MMFRFYAESKPDPIPVESRIEAEMKILDQKQIDLASILQKTADLNLLKMTEQINIHNMKLILQVQEYSQKYSTAAQRNALNLLLQAANHYMEVQNQVLILLNTTTWVNPPLSIKVLEDSQNKLQAALCSYRDSVMLEERKKFKKNLLVGALVFVAGILLIVGGTALMTLFP